ncbi:MAG TPA: putative baseplate assembly protein [Pyrinomonadaceae bacterium]|nr:putative baseplate assembly protein [Pyrinomonadaceae bacterium]
MAIPNPILDDRSYQQLRDELVLRIPVYTPEWTDHNASDPGITLIELFAFLGENLLYRFNQIPEAARLEFLRLLQIPMRPAVAATALVTFTTDKPKGVVVPVEAGLWAGKLSFETKVEAKVWPISFMAVGRVRTADPNPEAEPEVSQSAANVIDALRPLPPGSAPVYYQNQTVDLKNPPVDFSKTVDGKLWIAVLKEKGFDEAEMGGALLNIGLTLDPVFASMDEVAACPGAGATTKAPAVEWKVSTGKINAGKPQYLSIAQEADSTRGLRQDGVVRLRLPQDTKQFGKFTVDDPAKLGTGDFPPALDEETEENIFCWLSAFRHDGSLFDRVLYVGANAAEVDQTKKAGLEFLGIGTGQPDQRYKLVNKSIKPSSAKLDVDEGPRWSEWTEVDSFHASQPDDHHFVIDVEAGEVRFGNGLQGLPPQLGQRIRVREYRFGGGVEGNVPAKAISKVAEFPEVKVSNPLRAHGGADAESISDALSRIPGELRRRDRAVTATDFQELALATPGADVGRAECLPRFYPPTKQGGKAGVVTVVVWPREDAANPNAPSPDRNLLRAVCSWLDQRRLVTTELYVVPPTYRKVAVAVALEVKAGYGIEAVRHWVELVLRQYLAPLRPYGPEGQGWPLGRRVHGPELEAAALQVEGVKFLNELKVARLDERSNSWIEGSVTLEDYEVPELAQITVVEGASVIPFDASIEPPPPKDGPVPVPVPIPIIREEC